MKNVSWYAVLGLLLSVLLVGCGEKSQESILNDLDEKIADMTGYKTTATMTMQTGQEPQTYDVDVWHKAENYFRVALNNQEKDQSQIILRNDDGVFVLTPALNKSFRFQSDWPKNSSQAYMYDSLIGDILMDPERVFTATDDHYIFQTNTNYPNKNLSTQEITLRKKGFGASQVKIMNSDLEVLVQLDFAEFELNPEFNESDFDMERNMTGEQLSDEPTMAESEEAEAIVVHYPMEVPQGIEFDSSHEIDTENGTRYVLQYSGEKSFTLIQERSQEVPAMVPVNVTDGEPVDLGFTIGVMKNDSLEWSYNGVDFYLASSDLDEDEMMSIARSVYGTHEK